uniref:Sulfhydryl oxidase n=1 Tax=Ditylenchus dipsaci TaxID=166011 RepID=A0A915EBI0_9BILA
MTQNNELSKVTKPEDVVLWLWRAHNNVNKRLAGETSEDPKFPKQQFPRPSCAPIASHQMASMTNKNIGLPCQILLRH